MSADLGGNVRRIGPYRIERRLGTGGMGVVYLGRDDAAGTFVAVKVIKPEFAADQWYRARLRRELAAARRVPRFCTAPVVGADLDADPPYIATEYIDAPTLDVAMLERGPMRGADLDGLATGIAVALQAIHAQGVVHRDLKPSNILLSGVGPRVIDFGIARLEDVGTQLTQAGGIVGTLAYMAPEQLSGGPVTAAVDLFAWAGVVTYAATGRPPFGADGEVRRRILTQRPDVDGLEEPLRGLVLAAFTKDHTQRPSASEIVHRLSSTKTATTSQILQMATAPPVQMTQRAAPVPAPVPPVPVPPLPAAPTPPGGPRRTQGLRGIHWAGIAATAVVVAVGGAALAFVLNGGAKRNEGPAATTSSAARNAAAPPAGCVYSPGPGQDVGRPAPTPRYRTTVTTTLHTNLGNVVMDLDGAKAPCTVNSFAYLASKNFFDRTTCHRLVTEGIKVLQCGDPTGTGTGGPAYKFKDENLPKPTAGTETATYTKGTLAMANAGPGTNASQFFIVYGDSKLPPSYTIFGKVTSGLEIVETVARAGVKAGATDGVPNKTVTIQDVTI